METFIFGVLAKMVDLEMEDQQMNQIQFASEILSSPKLSVDIITLLVFQQTDLSMDGEEMKTDNWELEIL